MNTRSSYRDILRLAAPLILTMSSLMIMQFIDALLLSRFSAAAVAAVVPAGMASWLLVCAFHGTAGYTSTLVAQYAGAGRTGRVASSVWQGVYFSAVSGAGVAMSGFAARFLFTLVGHEQDVREMEIVYFAIICAGAPLTILGSALSGFFSGLHRTAVIFLAHSAGTAVNVVLDLALIFGNSNRDSGRRSNHGAGAFARVFQHVEPGALWHVERSHS
jgi:MATE family multidrug resistance protein